MQLAIANPVRYRGYYYDQDTGLYYLNARYYSPELRRFISPDDTAYLDPESIDGLNLYAYCCNDPVNYADPSGNGPITAILIGLGIGALFGGTFAGISSYREGNRGITLIGDILGGALVGGALGAAGAIGGLFGAGMIGLKATGIALGLSTIGSFGAGVGAYALEQTWGRGIEWNTTDAMISGVVLALESFIHFTIGAAFSAGGLWRSLNKGQIKQMYSALYGLGLSKTASAMGALTMYFSENAMQMALRFGIKYLYTYPWKFIRENLNASY